MNTTTRHALEAARAMLDGIRDGFIPTDAEMLPVLVQIRLALNPPTKAEPTFTARYGAGLGGALDRYASRGEAGASVALDGGTQVVE